MAFEWYVAKAKRFQTVLAETHLRIWGIEVYNPRILGPKNHAKKWEELFPGYLFCRVDTSDSDIWPALLWTPGVRCFLPPEAHPLSLTEKSIEEIRQRVETWNQGGYSRVFNNGERLRVRSGPLKGLDAIFERYLPARDRCEVFLSWLGRGLPTVMDPADLDIATDVGSSGAWVKGYGRIRLAAPRPSIG